MACRCANAGAFDARCYAILTRMDVRALQPLDDAALAALIREETPRLLGVLRSFTEQDEDVEDLLQQLWIIAVTHAHKRNARMPLGAWLHRVALNLGRSYFRRAKRRRWLRLRWAADLPKTTVDPPALSAESARRTRLWKAIAALPSLQRDVILLRLVEELNTREVAERLGRAEGTVNASLHRALKSLRQHVTAEDSR